MKRFLKIKINYDDAVVTVQPVGIADVPKVFVHVAAEFFTKVPDDATFDTQESIYVVLGAVVNIAFI